jgi:hypothetical protein
MTRVFDNPYAKSFVNVPKMEIAGKSVWPCREVAGPAVSEHLRLRFSGSICALEKYIHEEHLAQTASLIQSHVW